MEKDAVSGILKVGVKLISTGIELRDEHLKDKYLEVASFPEATLTLVNVSLNEKNFQGKLLLHGIEQDITGTAQISNQDNVIKVQASFMLKLSDYKIAIPSFQGITVAENVTVNTELTLRELK